MAKKVLPTNFMDDILNESMNGKRRWTITRNDDGTYTLEDATTYDQLGNTFGQAQVNEMNKAINESVDQARVIDDYKTLAAVNQEGFVSGAKPVAQLISDLDVGSDSGMTIGSMVKAIYDKVINSAAISGHLRGGRSRGGSGTGEVTFNNIKKGSTITISSVVIPSGAGEAIKTTVDGNIVITGAGSYTLTKDGTVKITAHVYLGEEGTSGYAECDFKIV